MSQSKLWNRSQPSRKWYLLPGIAIALGFALPTRAAIVESGALSTPILTQTSPAQQLLRQGIDRYQGERYTEAVEL